MSPELIATNVTVLSVALSKGRSVEEIGLLAAVFSQLGDTLATIATAQALAEERCCPDKSLSGKENAAEK